MRRRGEGLMVVARGLTQEEAADQQRGGRERAVGLRRVVPSGVAAKGRGERLPEMAAQTGG